ncbi:MAG TPA: RDD family protein [Acidimicrobiia bacterium]|nr:RDD family protein [Acidimicrobiia bacterium]
MTFDDRISISTPEGLAIEINLAGLGSRIAAGVIDGILLGILVLLAAFGAFGLADWLENPLLAIGIGWLVVLILMIGYFVAFEVFNDGRTPGKALFSIKVLGLDGEPVGFGPSVVRNLMRLVDLFPALPVLGAISILVSERNQRLGDLAARTIVVRVERPTGVDTATPVLDTAAVAWDVSDVGDSDLELARRFLLRRDDLTAPKRQELVATIAGRLRERVPGLPPEADDEWLVEQVVAAKAMRRGT